jgi:hypothetical protein
MGKVVGVGRADIHEEAVQSYIRAGGEVNDLLNVVAQGTAAYGKAYVAAGHVRSGRLLKGIGWNRTKLTGIYTGQAIAYSSAKHTIFFHEGTRAEITGIRGPMVVPRSNRAAHTNLYYAGAGAEKLAMWSREKAARTAHGGKNMKGKGVIRKDSVRGQRAKPFLTQGLSVSMASQGLI